LRCGASCRQAWSVRCSGVGTRFLALVVRAAGWAFGGQAAACFVSRCLLGINQTART
jgi:hypothetical protein